jgi:hypothetical protein
MATSATRFFTMFPELASIHEEVPSAHELSDDELDSSTSSSPFDLDEDVAYIYRTSPLLQSFQSDDCLLDILNFLTFEDLNTFSLVSKECYNIRCNQYLDQTRSGTICISGKGVKSAVQLMEKVKQGQWHKSFQGNRTHLRLQGLNHLSSDIESIDSSFVRKCSPLASVTSLDCSEHEKYLASKNGGMASRWLSRYEDYIDKGFAHGLALSLLVPNLKEIDISLTSLTSMGVSWLAKHVKTLECIRWNHSLIWPVNHQAYDILRACQDLKELHIDDARLLFTPPRSTRRAAEFNQDGVYNNDENNNDDNANEVEEMWASLAEYSQKIERISCRRAKWYQNSKFRTFSQEGLMKFVRSAPRLKWFRSDLTPENIAILQQERPEIVFC